MNPPARALRLLLASDFEALRNAVQANPAVAERLVPWLASLPAPMSIGDALFRMLLHRVVDICDPQVLTEYCNACRVENRGGFLPIPRDDDRWGKVAPVPDVYSTAQGAILEAIAGGSGARLTEARATINQMVIELPVNLMASDTSLDYRKLSELLLQAHLCATVAVFDPDQAPDEALLAAAARAYTHAAESSFGDRFATTIFRVSTMRWVGDFRMPETGWVSERVGAAVLRLEAEGGVLEYRPEDKVDERAGSRSRSSRDQAHPWTYSTAYGAIALSMWGLGAQDLHQTLLTTLKDRLNCWPEREPELRIKEFDETVSQSATAYGALSALAALAMR